MNAVHFLKKLTLVHKELQQAEEVEKTLFARVIVILILFISKIGKLRLYKVMMRYKARKVS